MGRQRGLALLFGLLLSIIGVGLFIVNASQDTTRIVASDMRLASSLSEMKEALIAYAVAHKDRPGALPCPDTDDDGIAETLPLPASPCGAYIGRLPWRTLGIGDVRDESGERFWYALSPNFRESVPVSSDTKGDRVVRSATTAVTVTSEAVAIVFAPGAALGNQLRDFGVAACAATTTSIARNWCADNYLETAATVNNASNTGPYIAADPSNSFNDRLIVLRTPDLMPLVERRVAADIRRVLITYRETSRAAILAGGCNCYPWPDGGTDQISDTGQNRGRIPVTTAAPHNWGTTLTDKLTGTVYTLPTLPGYFEANGWQAVLYYAVGRNALQNSGLWPTACTTCTGDPLLPPPTLLQGTLSIDNNIGHAVVLITPGSAGPSRPSASWANYIDDALNSDGDDRFVTPASKAFDRDRLHTIGDDLPPASCRTNAQMLIYNAPCHLQGGGNDVKPVCNKAASNLYWCSQCSGDATVMINPPCRNTLNPSACQTAVANLQACKL